MTTPFPFSSGQTLTAAQMNAITTLPITAKTASATLTAAESVGYRVTMSNASATTITINSAVYGVGDTVEILNIGAGTTTLTAGAGVTLSTAGSLAVVQNQGGTLVMTSSTAGTFYPTAVAGSSGLIYVTGASFSAVSSVSAATSTFTTTYTNYRIMLNLTAASVNSIFLNYRMRASGVDDSSANYTGVIFGASTSSTVNTNTFLNQTSCGLFVTRAGDEQATSFDIFAPQVAARTKLTGSALGDGAGALIATQSCSSVMNTATSFDAITFFPASGTITGNYKIYGYANS